MKAKIILLSLVLIIGTTNYLHAQTNNVSSKLDDFDDGKDNASTIVEPAAVITTRRPHREHNAEEASPLSGDGGDRSGPKIHGVRVTVNTGENDNSKETKSNVELADVGKHTKRIGIHTDITFELSGDDVANVNASTSNVSGEDASVPIYKGRGSTSKSRKAHESRLHRRPNYSSERRDDVTFTGAHYPQYPHSVPSVYAGTGSGHDNGDGWKTYVPPSNVWTTERYYSDSYRSGVANGYRVPSWKPCYCSYSDSRRRRRRRRSNDFNRFSKNDNNKVGAMANNGENIEI